MRVLIFHGYLLRGTGSNIYNANLAQALVRLGHEVHLLCQDRDASELEWVHAVGRWGGAGLEVEGLREPQGEGSLTVYSPDIGRLLPVYVEDRYAEFDAKAYPKLTDAELDRYISANVDAAGEVAARAGGVDAALANHLIMGPLVLARAGLRFAAKVHGSALEYTVKPNPRFLPHAAEGAGAAEAILVGSRHTAESLWEALPDLDLKPKTRLGPPGVDVDEFAPLERSQAESALERLAVRIEASKGEEAFGRDRFAAAGALRDFAAASGPRVIFVGKLIVSKGVDLLLAAWPLVQAAHPGARLLIVAFGGYEEGLRRLLGALGDGDLSAAREVAELGRALEGGEREPLRILDTFLADPPAGYAEAARKAAGSVSFSGRLEHDEVAEVLPAANALVMPSTFPEAFGMVAAEAAACGVLPISADHSGMREVSRELSEALADGAAGLVSFELNEDAVRAIAGRLNGWLALGEAERQAARDALVETVRRLWSWEGVARGVLAASQGRLGELPLP